MSVNTCTVTLCNTDDWWSDVLGEFVLKLKSKASQVSTGCESWLGCHVKILVIKSCVGTLKWLQVCGGAVYGEVLLWINLKKSTMYIHSGPNRNLTHFRGFHYKSCSSSNNHFLLLSSYSEVLFFFDSVVALHLYRYCLDPKEKRKKKSFPVLFSCLIISRTLFMFHQ